jgi:hypothetical protein
VVSPPIYYPPYPDQGLPIGPAHPIAPGGQPGYPAHPIAPGGPPPWVSHPIPPEVWPQPPGGGGGTPPGIWGGTPPNWIDNTLPGTPPGIWGGTPPNWIDNTLPGAQPGWPTLDPGNLPEHPEVPDLNAGNWTFVQDPDTKAVVRGFIPWPLAITHPDYNPNYPEQGLPGKWVLVATNNPAPGILNWCWIPSSGDGGGGGGGTGGGEKPDHTLPGDLPRPDQGLPPGPDQGLPETPPDSSGGGGEAPDHTLPGDLPKPDQGLPENPEQPPQQPEGQPDQTLPGDLPHPDQGLPPDQPVVDPR